MERDDDYATRGNPQGGTEQRGPPSGAGLGLAIIIGLLVVVLIIVGWTIATQ